MAKNSNSENSPAAEDAEDKKDKKPPYPFARIESDLADLIDGFPVDRLGPNPRPFPHKFKTLRIDDDSEPVVIEIKDRVAHPRSLKYVASKLKKYCKDLKWKASVYNIPLKKLQEVAATWADQHESEKEFPVAVAFQGWPKLAWQRLPFGERALTWEELLALAPVFADYLQRIDISMRDVVAGKFGSILDPKANRKQMMWFYGETNGGKSQLAYLLKLIVGKTNFDTLNHSIKEEYWQAKMVNKRVLVVPEAPIKFIKSDAFKMMTGDSDQSGRSPYGQIIDFVCNVLFFSFSNKHIKEDDPSILSRIIPVYIQDIPEERKLPEPEVREALERELPVIVQYCWHIYKTKFVSGMPFSVECKEVKKYLEEKDQEVDDFIDWYLQDAPDDPRSYVGIDDLKKKMVARGIAKTSEEKEKVIEKIIKEGKGAIYKQRPRIDGRRFWVLKGVWYKNTREPLATYRPEVPLEHAIAPAEFPKEEGVR